MFKIFQKMSFSRFKQILTVTLILFLTSGIILFWVNSSIVEQTTVTTSQRKMLVLARSGAKSLESLLSLFKSELVILANEREIKDNLPGARILMTGVILTANHPIVHQLGLISKEGILLVIANKEGVRENEGNSLSDRNYFQWAKTAKKGEVFLSEPIVGRSGINKGKWVVVIATPIIKDDGKFNGVLFAPIRIEELTVNYIETLKVSPTTRVFVLNQEGTIVSSPFKDLIGVDVREYARREKWKGYETTLELVEAMTKGEEGSRVYWFRATDGKVGKTIVGFTPIKFDGNMISLGVAIPYEEAYNLIRDFFRNQVIWLIFLILIGIVIAFFWTIGLSLSRRDGYNSGLKDGVNFKKT